MGAEADATWLVDNSGQEATYCCLNAVLRDYARLGLLLAHDGNWRGRQIIPAAWVMDATTVRADQPHLRPGTATPCFGYGYQTWILPGERRMFLLWGVRGQRIYRRSAEQARHGEHRRAQAARRRAPRYGRWTRSGRRWCVSSAAEPAPRGTRASRPTA